MVHISGISDPDAVLNASSDAHRILVDGADRCETVSQVTAFREAGYDGAFSFECTDARVQKRSTLAFDLRRSFDWIDLHV